MMQRCLDPTRDNYHLYGGKGITVCDRWRDFKNFLADMGERPAGKTLDRIDSKKNYEPRNCRWADKFEQANNKVTNINLELNGEIHTMAEWAAITGIPYSCLHKRIKTLGWTATRALTTASSKEKGNGIHESCAQAS